MITKSVVFALLPRAGLANRLFIWAEACLFAERNQLSVYTHGWGHIHIGPWLRGERSKRFYYYYFAPNTNFIGYYCRRLLATMNRHRFTADPKVSAPPNKETATFLFTKMPKKVDYFKNLRESEEYLKTELLRSLRSKYRSAVEEIEAFPVAMHVRRGDFVVGGCELTSDDYFISVVEKLRRTVGPNSEIRIFSDAPPEELPNLLSLPNVNMASAKPDIVELFEISKAGIIVTSLGSTFGYWAAFLSDADIILDSRHAFGEIRSNASVDHFEGTIDDYLSYCNV